MRHSWGFSQTMVSMVNGQYERERERERELERERARERARPEISNVQRWKTKVPFLKSLEPCCNSEAIGNENRERVRWQDEVANNLKLRLTPMDWEKILHRATIAYVWLLQCRWGHIVSSECRLEEVQVRCCICWKDQIFGQWEAKRWKDLQWLRRKGSGWEKDLIVTQGVMFSHWWRSIYGMSFQKR